MRKALGNKSTHTHVVTTKSLQKFDQLEQTFKNLCKDTKKLRPVWDRLDFNGNNIVSLAEIDKMCVEAYPLLGNLIYFNKIFWLFDHSDSDKDRRLTEKEFKW